MLFSLFLNVSILWVLIVADTLRTIKIKLTEESGLSSNHEFTSSSPEGSEELRRDIKMFCETVAPTSQDCEAAVSLNFATTQVMAAAPWSNRETVLQKFTSDLVGMSCIPNTHRFPNEDLCRKRIASAIRGIKMVQAFQTSYKLTDMINNNTLIPMEPGWQDNIEGNTFAYASKVGLLQDQVDDDRIVRICEVGFNMGHSTLNWLTANPVVSVLAFDITRTLYTSAAVNTIYELFPNRSVTLITGDSALSVPNYSKLIYGSATLDKGKSNQASIGLKYNLIFIDGNHEYEGALRDIVNLAVYANASFHRIVVDDGLHPAVRKAWDDTIKMGIVRTISIQPVVESTCTTAVAISRGALAGGFEFKSCSKNDEKYHFDDLIVGEYVLK